MSLDPRATAREKFAADAPKREKFVLAANRLEVPVYEPAYGTYMPVRKVRPFNPGVFGLDGLPDPSDPRTPVIPGLRQR